MVFKRADKKLEEKKTKEKKDDSDEELEEEEITDEEEEEEEENTDDDRSDIDNKKQNPLTEVLSNHEQRITNIEAAFFRLRSSI